jgi:hypothetical protein
MPRRKENNIAFAVYPNPKPIIGPILYNYSLLATLTIEHYTLGGGSEES